jgi:hypothetical protein
VNVDQFFRAGLPVQPVHILGQQHKAIDALLDLHQRVMPRVRLRPTRGAGDLCDGLPGAVGIVADGVRGQRFQRAVAFRGVVVDAALAAVGRHARLSRDPRARDNANAAHTAQALDRPGWKLKPHEKTRAKL